MPDFGKILWELLLRPFWDWVRGLKWPWKVALLTLLCAIAAALYQIDNIAAFVRILQAPVGAVPLTATTDSEIQSTLKELSASLYTELRRASRRLDSSPIANQLTNEGKALPSVAQLNPWSTAQIVVALDGTNLLSDVKDYASLLRVQRGKGQPFWKKFGIPCQPPHVGATSWILFAIASIKGHLEDDELKWLLDQQDQSETGGWWPIFPSINDSRFGSTYATAWAMHALNRFYEEHLIPPNREGAVTLAISRGWKWLRGNQVPGQARWKTYPSDPSRGAVSLSCSGLVMHVLHEIQAPLRMGLSLQEIDRLWLSQLPDGAMLPSDFEATNTMIRTSEIEGMEDTVRQYKLQWLLIATKDAFSDGSLWERKHALQWIESALVTVKEPDLYKYNWITSELVIALRYLRGERVI